MAVWKDVIGYESRFMVSNDGQIMSKLSGKILRQHINPNGYFTLATKIGGRAGEDICFRVHRLVAEAFCENPQLKPIVNHLDGRKTNNHYTNLEWCTHQENTIHAREIGLIKPTARPTFRKLSEDQVSEIRSSHKPFDRIFGSRALGRKYGVTHNTIQDVLLGKTYQL